MIDINNPFVILAVSLIFIFFYELQSEYFRIRFINGWLRKMISEFDVVAYSKADKKKRKIMLEELPILEEKVWGWLPCSELSLS